MRERAVDLSLNKKVAALIARYGAGACLTPEELSEIRQVDPEFALDETAGGSAAPPLHLTPEPSPALGEAELSRVQLERWSGQYGVEHRQLRRWIARGKERGDPCPLDDPARMPAWVDKHLDKVRSAMREKVQAAADAALRDAPKLAPEPCKHDACADPPQAPQPQRPHAAPTIAPLDLATVGGVEGESVDFFRRVFAGVKLQLEEAYASGTEERIRVLHGRLEKVGESLRKHEVAAEARAKRLGEYLDKSEVINEVMTALRTLALLREHRITRVRAELSDLPQETLDRLSAVLDQVGRAEEQALRNLSAFRTTADVLFALAA